MAGRKTEEVDLNSQKSQQELLIEKIQHLLDRTNPEDWRKGGAPLDRNARFKKPQNTWEEIYTLPVPSGVLAMRKSTPVKSDFLGRGFMLAPLSAPEYTVELRPHGWHHSELTDPYKRTQLSDRSCRVLSEGDIAKAIYRQVEEAYMTFHDSQQASFNKEAYDFACRIPALLREETTSLWDRTEETAGEVHFSTEMNGMRLDLVHQFSGGRENFELTISKMRMQAKIDDRMLVKEIYQAVEQLGTTSRLYTLSQALEEL